MPILTANGFFQGFNFDTLLSLISCVTGVVALFLGGAAYNQCRIIKNSFNDKKEFEDNSQDHSQRAAGDIINNNGMSDEQLTTFTTALTTITNDNFSKAIDRMYATFRLQTDENMKHIVSEAERIVRDSKWQIAGYTKVDWINIYFESAKNASDAYMQNVWAKVLAMEMAAPGTFSFKTLDVLKNLSSKEFAIFEKLASIELHHAILKGDYLDDIGLDWETLQRIKDFGLISLEGSTRTVIAKPNASVFQFVSRTHALKVENDSNMKKELNTSCYLLTAPAQELLAIVDRKCTDEVAIKIAETVIKSDSQKQFTISLHKITRFLPNGQFNYEDTNLIECK